MKKLILSLLAILLLFTSCQKQEAPEEPDGREIIGGGEDIVEGMRRIDALSAPEALLDRFSYAYGALFAEGLEDMGKDVVPDYFIKGFLDHYSSSLLFTSDEMEEIFIEFQSLMIGEEQKKFDEEKKENAAEAENFLRINKMRTGVSTTKSGLQYERIKDSECECARMDSTIVMDYTMTLLNGTIVESSTDRGEKAIVKVNDLPRGFAEAVMMMGEGDKWRFWIPPELAFGEDGTLFIGPNELIIFEVTVYEVR